MNRSWIGGLVIVAAVLLVVWKVFLGPNPHDDALAARTVATRGLAEALAARHPGQRAIVLSNPFVRRPETDRRIVRMEEAGLRGLQEALAGRLGAITIVYPELRPEARENPRAVPIDTETTTPLSYLMAVDAVDRAVAEHPEAGLVISLVGLPVDLAECEAWKREGGPSFGLLLPDLRMVGGAAAVAAAMRSGKLSAVVLRKPNGVGDDVPPGADARAEFDRRFLLVTRENVDEIVRQSPGLLEQP
jgi:hypothetical protein